MHTINASNSKLARIKLRRSNMGFYHEILFLSGIISNFNRNIVKNFKNLLEPNYHDFCFFIKKPFGLSA